MFCLRGLTREVGGMDELEARVGLRERGPADRARKRKSARMQTIETPKRNGKTQTKQKTHQRQQVGRALLERGAQLAVEHLDVDQVDGQLARVLVELLAVSFWLVLVLVLEARARERVGERRRRRRPSVGERARFSFLLSLVSKSWKRTRTDRPINNGNNSTPLTGTTAGRPSGACRAPSGGG